MIPLGLMATLCLIADPSVSTDWLLKKNEEALGRIFSLRATLESRISLDGGATWLHVETIRLVRSGPRERVDEAIVAVPINGVLQKASSYGAVLNTPEMMRGLGGMDPDHPPPDLVSYIEHEITGKGPRVSGRIAAPQTRGPHGYHDTNGPNLLGFVVDPHHSLRELAQSSGNVVPIQGHDDHGDPTWVLRLNWEEGHATYTVHLNPKYGYMISAWQMTAGYEIDWQVEEFQEPAPGIFIAKVTRRTIKRPNLKRPMIVEDAITVADVNRPIPESDLRLEFPPGTLIGDERDQSFNIWGDGKPALKFKSKSEFNKWRMDQMVRAMTARRRWWSEPWTITLMIGSALVLMALLLYRRRLMRRERAVA